MPNADYNLVPLNQRSPEEKREIARKGQIACAEAKRRKKNMREVAKLLLDMEVPPTQEQTRAQMRAVGVNDEDMTYSMQIMLAMLAKAVKGDVNAAKFIRETSGISLEDTAEKLLEGAQEVEDVVIYLPDNNRDDLKDENK